MQNQQNQLLDQWAQLGRTALESYRALGEIQLSVFSRLLQQQLELVNVTAESGLRQLNLVYDPGTYRQLVEKQAELAGEITGQLATVARRTNDVLDEANNKLSAWADKNVRVVAQQAQQAQQTAQEVQRTTQQVQAAAGGSARKTTAA